MQSRSTWRRPFLHVIFTTILLAVATVAAAQPFVYAGVDKTNSGHFGTSFNALLKKLDAVTGRELGALEVSTTSIGDVLVSPDGSRVYVSVTKGSYPPAALTVVVDAATLTKLTTITVPDLARGTMAISPDGASLYLGTLSSLVIIDTASSTIRATVPLTGKAQTVVLSPDGARAYVTVSPSSTDAGVLAVIDTASAAVSSTATVGVEPYGLALSPDAGIAYVGNAGSRTVSIVDTASHTITRDITLPVVNDDSGAVLSPQDLVLTADGATMYVQYKTAVQRLDVVRGTFSTIRPPAGSYVGRPEMAPGGDHLYLSAARAAWAPDSYGYLVYWHYDDLYVVAAGSTEVDRMVTRGFAPWLGQFFYESTAALAFPPAIGCLFEVPDRDRPIDMAGGTGTLTIPAPAGCGWTLDAAAATFVTFTSATSGTGSGTVSYSVPAYTGTLPRQDTVRVNGQDVRFSQIVSAVTVDTYADGGTVMENPTLSGWALDADPSVTTGTGVDAVHIWAYPNPGSGANPIFLGAAEYGVNRFDVVQLGYPFRFLRSGFTLTTTVPIGRYQIVFFAHRTRTNDFTLVRAITVDVKRAAVIDAPAANATVSFPFEVAGWAIDPSSTSSTGIRKVEVLATPAAGGTTLTLGTATYDLVRPDVAAAYGSQFYYSGFSLMARPGAGFTSGVWRIVLRLTTSRGAVAESAPTTVTIAKQRQITIDTPINGDVGGTPFTIAGWAVNVDAPSGTGVDAVHVWAWPTSGASPIFLGAATLGIARPDIAAVFGSQFNAAGFSLVVTDLPAGDYTIVAYAHSTTTGQFDQAHAIAFHCYGPGFPAMNLEGPANGAVFAGSVPIQGWAIDGRAAWGTGIDAIHIWAFPTNGEAPIFVATVINTILVEDRPDVAQVFGSRYRRAGFALRGMWAVTLPVGTYDLAVYARSAATGQFDQQRVARITIQP
jgi:YVTN family beta-propeller protein